MNINALLQKTIVVNDILHENNISILCLTETKLDPNDTLLSIPGYKLLRKDRQRGGGGVAILIRNDIAFKIIDVQGVETTESKLEILTIQIQVRKYKSLLISTVYRPKFQVSNNDILTLEHFFRELSSCKHTFFACGDFNIHIEKKHDNSTKKFLSLLSRLDLCEIINKPTRNATHLDLIITNDKSHSLQTDTFHGLSDHEGIFVQKSLSTIKPDRKTITFRNYRHINLCEFAQAVISNPDLDDLSNSSIDEDCTKFITVHRTIYDQFAPVRKKTIRDNLTNLYISDHTNSLKRFRNKLLEANRRSPNDTNRLRIRTLDKLIKTAIHNDTKYKLENEIRTKGIWNIRNILLRKTKPFETQFDPNVLNNHFCSISNEPINITCPPKPVQCNFEAGFKLHSISVGEMIRSYKKLNNRLRSSEDQSGLAPIMLSHGGSLNSQVASEGGCGTEWPGFNSRWEWVFFSAHPSFPHSATTVGI
jgi:hypothetical protein